MVHDFHERVDGIRRFLTGKLLNVAQDFWPSSWITAYAF